MKEAKIEEDLKMQSGNVCMERGGGFSDVAILWRGSSGWE